MLTLLRPGAAHTDRKPLGRPFRIYQSAVVSSDLADGIYRIATPLLALGITRSAFAVAMVGLAVRLPWLVATLPAGVVADRYEPRTVMRWASGLRLVLMTLMCLLAVFDRLPLWLLAVTAFAIGCAGTFVDVAAQSALPRLVDKDQLPRANSSVQSTQMFLAQLLGPALGGFVVGLGSGQGLATVAALYAVTVWALGRLPGGAVPDPVTAPAQPPAGAAGPVKGKVSFKALVSELGEGLRYFRGRPDLGRLAVAAAANNLSYSMCLTLLPLWAVAPGRLGLSETTYGLLLSCLAVGSVLAGPLTGRLVRRFGQQPLMRYGGPVLGLCFLALAVPSVPVVAAGLFCYGLVVIVWNVSIVSYRQTTIPAALFGRVNAAYRWITWGVFPLGSLIAGALAATVGLAWVFLAAGAVPLLAAVAFPANATYVEKETS
ncbi:transmembrane secretion effector [Streptomyces sp. 2132.2]|uniref:MFS transporter n=1 Tax=Streptomyces sp. 2132.2 TaxID=2485161 RepID=UPI000FB2C2EB|nr:MFS transporter [Streptomyces sp. 2132.2]ROQ96965.1 transmembrane secretion effector [Streptomyces sp. 2132.2]